MSTVIIRNGKIYMERGRFAEALMIEGGIITHAGSEADIMTGWPMVSMLQDGTRRFSPVTKGYLTAAIWRG